MRHLLAVSLLLCLGAADLAAQSGPVLGTRVRVVQSTTSLDDARTRRAGSQTGVLQALDSTSVTLQVGGRSVVYPLNTLTRIDASSGNASVGRGSTRGAVRGALIGAGVGAVAALLGRVADSSDCPAGEDCSAKKVADLPDAAILIGGGAAAGGAVGALTGSVSRENWTPVWTSPRAVAMSVDRSNSGGTQVGLTFRF